MIAYFDNTNTDYVSSASGINFSAKPSGENGRGLYLLSNTIADDYPILYFRGGEDSDNDGIEDTLNNNVIFGGFCWKIVRTTELGGTKLIYNGVPNENNQCLNKGKDALISLETSFNLLYASLADVGYMYGKRYVNSFWLDKEYMYASDVEFKDGTYTLSSDAVSTKVKNKPTLHYTCKNQSTTCTEAYYVYSYYGLNLYGIKLTGGEKLKDIIDNSFANKNDSVVKKLVDTWFKNNLTNENDETKKDYREYLENAVWCNDRSIYAGGYLSDFDLTTNTIGSHVASGKTFFNGAIRNTTLHTPAIKDEYACKNVRDRLMLKDGSNAENKVLDYSVGLLTADEYALAGTGDLLAFSSSAYLNIGQDQWTMTPYYAAGDGNDSHNFYVINVGNLNENDVYSVHGVRPSIVLKKDIVAKSGNGSIENPFIVE